jgi:putative ABC transport system permease protein
VAVPGGHLLVLMLSALVFLRVGTVRNALGGGFGLSVPLWARRASGEGDAVGESTRDRPALGEIGRQLGILSGAENVSRALERAASGEGAVGPATTVGERAVVPLLETFASVGFGAGGGGGVAEGAPPGGGGGGGGGGVGRSRTIAVAIVGPEGVKIRPVVDVTGLALPAASAIAAVLVGGAGRRRRRRR